MTLHDLLALLTAAGLDHDRAWRLAFYHLFGRRAGEGRHQETDR